MIVATAEVEINARLNDIDKKLETALKQASERAGEAAEKALADKFKGFGDKMTKFVTLPVLGAFGLATKAASDLGEQVAKSGQVFGDSSGEVEAFAKNAAKNLGLSERAALEAAGTYGNLFRAIGLTADKSAEMSIEMVKLASDLASFNNANPEEVLEALRSGLVGETEPLKKFGINLNEARLQQEALNLGLSNGKGTLDASSKAQAAYSLILKDTSLAQGDFARTSDGLANQSRILKAKLEDTAATMGEKLIPIALKVAGAIGAILDGLLSLPSAVQSVILVGAGMLAIVGPIASVIGTLMQLRIALEAGGVAAGLLSKGLKALSVGTVAGLAITAVATAVAFLNRETEATDEQLSRLQAHLLTIGNTSKKYKGQLSEVTMATLALRESMGDKEAGDMFDAIDKSLAELVKSGNAKAAKQAIEEIAASSGTTSKELLASSHILDDYKTAVAESETATKKKTAADKEAAKAQAETKNEVEVSADAYDKLEDSINKTKDAMDRYLGVELSLGEATDNYQAAMDDMDQSLKDNGITFESNTEKGRSNNAGLRTLVESVGEFQRAEELASGVTLTDNQRKERQIQLLQDWSQNKGPAVRAEVQRFIDKMKETPEERAVRVRAETDQAVQAIDRVKAALDRVKVALALKNVSNALQGIFRAKGGPVTAGQPYVVGEEGPELMIPGMSGTVASNSQVRQVVQSMSSSSVSHVSAGVAITFAPVITGGYADRQALMSDLRSMVNNEMAQTIRQVVNGAKAPAGVAA